MAASVFVGSLPPTYFPIPRLPDTCAQCACVILDSRAGSVEAQDKGYRRVYFNVISGKDAGARLFISLCPVCEVDRDWPAERIAALEAQCKAGWAVATRGKKAGWDGSDIALAFAGEPARRWAEVQ